MLQWQPDSVARTVPSAILIRAPLGSGECGTDAARASRSALSHWLSPKSVTPVTAYG
jgi:hypothetical protein